MQIFKKPSRRVLWGIFLALLLVLVPLAVVTGKKIYSNYRFLSYTDQLFAREMSQSCLNLHYTLADPASCGITRYSTSLGSFDTSQISMQYVTLENRLKKLDSFPFQDLSLKNRLAYDVLRLALETDLSGGNYYLLNEVLSPTLGTQAQLPILLAEYTFRTEQDIQDYLKLLSSVDEYFQGIISFERLKSREGTFMSDTTADRVISQCQAFIRDPDSNYLDSIFRDKIQSFPSLSEKKQNAYIELHSQLIRETLIPAYENLIQGLSELKGTGGNSGGLCGFSGGKEYYEYLLKSNCGLYDSVPQIQTRLLAQLQADVVESSQLLAQHPQLASRITQAASAPAAVSAASILSGSGNSAWETSGSGSDQESSGSSCSDQEPSGSSCSDQESSGSSSSNQEPSGGSADDHSGSSSGTSDQVSDSSSGSSSPEDILEILKEKLKADFPDAPAASYEIKSVHEDLEEYLSPAFYLTPPIDTLAPNAIYINGHADLSGSELFTTLAHEGFPGHLYQTVTFASTKSPNIRHMMNMGGYVEGWATYVESYAYQYQEQEEALSRLQWLNRSLNLCIYSLLDTGIHYDGWTLDKTSRFLSGFGITDPETTAEIYQVIVEDPTNYLKYYMGCLSFMDLRDEQMEALGNEFDLKGFHQAVLEIGPCQFPVLEKFVKVWK